MHDFDELGVPEGADRHWRHRMTEMWVRLAPEYQDRGIDLLLTEHSPLGEVLVTSSTPLSDGIAVCRSMSSTRSGALAFAEHDSGRWDAQAVAAFSRALGPRHRPDVIVHDSWPDTAWQRWTPVRSNALSR